MMEWLPLGMLLVLYAICFATIGVRTFASGHAWLGACGAVVPILWVLGVILPPRPRASHPTTSRRRRPPRDRVSPRQAIRSDESGTRSATDGGGRRTTLEPEQGQSAAAIYLGPNSRRLVRHQQAVRIARPTHGGPRP